VEINNPDVDPTQGLVELPAELVDASNSFATGCSAAGEMNLSSLDAVACHPTPASSQQ
jgi:large exoprotein involved in heme utilization and adhesion